MFTNILYAKQQCYVHSAHAQRHLLPSEGRTMHTLMRAQSTCFSDVFTTSSLGWLS